MLGSPTEPWMNSLMSTDAFAKMAEYFDSLVQEMKSEARQAGLLQNPTAVGTGREEIFRRLLERHLPDNCEVFRGGYVFNVEGETSRQIDVIATSGPTPRFEILPNLQAIAPLEGTICVGEVKTKLDRAELHKALENFASLPQITDPAKALNPNIGNVGEEFWWDWPYKVIFAYTAIDKETLYRHIFEFYDKRPEIPLQRRPSLIHVLGEYIIVRRLPGMGLRNVEGGASSEINTPVGGYFLLVIGADLAAMALMFSQLQQRAFLAYHMIWHYDRWIDRLMDKFIGRETNLASLGPSEIEV